MRILFLVLFLFIGCDNVQPINTTITEQHNGKSLSTNKGKVISVQLITDKNKDFYWTVDSVEGGLLILSENENNGFVVYKVQANSSGTIKFNYVQFTDNKSNILKSFVLKVGVN